MAKVKAIPDGYHSITPYLIFKSADAAIKFYERAFGAKEIMRLSSPDGGVGHAEIQVGDSHIMMADESPAFGNKGVETFGGSPASFMFYVENADAAFDQAVKAGATVKRPMADQFYGDRVGTLADPFGYQWSIGTHKEDLTTQEVQTRMNQMMKQMSAQA